MWGVCKSWDCFWLFHRKTLICWTDLTRRLFQSSNCLKWKLRVLTVRLRVLVDDSLASDPRSKRIRYSWDVSSESLSEIHVRVSTFKGRFLCFQIICYRLEWHLFCLNHYSLYYWPIRPSIFSYIILLNSSINLPVSSEIPLMLETPGICALLIVNPA